MNPFVFDRYIDGEPSWPAFRREALESLAEAVRSIDYIGGFAGPGRVLQVRARRAGMGKSHLVSRLVQEFQEEFEVLHLELLPENLREWERSWRKGLVIGGEGRRRRFLVLDHLDGFFGDPTAGMRIARLVEQFTDSFPRSVVLLALNRDVWRSLFAAQLPSALRDRLTWEVQDLPPASAAEAEGLIIHRMERAGIEDHVILQFLDQLDLSKDYGEAGQKGLSPREIFRRARPNWERFAAEEIGAGRIAVSLSKTLTGTEGGIVSPGLEVFPAADQARRHLHAVAEALRKQAGPCPGQEKMPAGPRMFRLLEDPTINGMNGNSPEPATAHLRVLPDEKPQTAPTFPERFQQMRLRFLDQQPIVYRPQLVYGFLSQVGKRFPSIRQSIVGEDLPVEERMLDWTMYGRRIGIGFAPLGETAIWNRIARSRQEPGELKLTGFGPAEEGMEVDGIELNPDLLATLYAAGELLESPKSVAPELSETEITGFLASEMDYFWSRLTRPRVSRHAERSEASPLKLQPA